MEPVRPAAEPALVALQGPSRPRETVLARTTNSPVENYILTVSRVRAGIGTVASTREPTTAAKVMSDCAFCCRPVAGSCRP